MLCQSLDPDRAGSVEEYLKLPQHQVERRPFRPWLLLGVVLIVVISMGFLSRLLSYLAL